MLGARGSLGLGRARPYGLEHGCGDLAGEASEVPQEAGSACSAGRQESRQLQAGARMGLPPSLTSFPSQFPASACVGTQAPSLGPQHREAHTECFPTHCSK
jgi:hypothetical protein